jgi:hypothetical protein
VNAWTVIKRLNSRADDWSRQSLERLITNIDSPNKRPARSHISIRDLVRSGRKSGKNSDEDEN